MKSINFDDGLKSFSINGDESRVIRFNPGDPNLLLRAGDAQKRILEWKGKLDKVPLKADGTPESTSDESAAALREFNSMLRNELNYVFNADVYDIVFAGQSPLCIVGNRKHFLFEAFLLSAMPIIEDEISVYNTASKTRIERYTNGYQE